MSLVRLEKQLQLGQAFGQKPDEAMRVLAGMYRIKYLFVYPQTGDIVLAGPAGDWRTDTEGRIVNVDTGIPVLQLDDLVVVLRNALEPARSVWLCDQAAAGEPGSHEGFCRRVARPVRSNRPSAMSG